MLCPTVLIVLSFPLKLLLWNFGLNQILNFLGVWGLGMRPSLVLFWYILILLNNYFLVFLCLYEKDFTFAL